jgi:hypothetical protein
VDGICDKDSYQMFEQKQRKAQAEFFSRHFSDETGFGGSAYRLHLAH